MSTAQTRRRPTLEVLEPRLALSATHGPHQIVMPSQHESRRSTAAATIPPGGTLTVLNEFTLYYPSVVGQPNYNPEFDLTHNGQVGQTDGRILLHSLPPLSPKIPLVLNLALAPRDQVHGHVPTNSGGVTYSKDPTVLGHTTPGALIFTGSGTVPMKLRGPAVVADAKGDFSFKVKLSSGINEYDFQAVDAYGQQTLRAYPILWMGFAKYESAHPTND
jgi:hypothetical protein